MQAVQVARHANVTAACVDLGDLVEQAVSAGTEEGLEAGFEQVEAAVSACATRGVPLVDVLRTIRATFRHVMETTAGGDHRDHMIELGDELAVTAAMTYARGHRAGERRRLGETLLDGREGIGLARSYGIEIAPAYHVLAVKARREGAGLVDALHRVDVAVTEHTDGSALPVFGPNGGSLLVPAHIDIARIERILTASNTGAELVATVVTAGVDGLPAAQLLAHRLLDVAAVLDQQRPVFRLVDLAVEVQVCSPGPGRDVLVSSLAPLGDKAHLMDTLHVYLSVAPNRRVAARRLHVHINTVGYRLRQIALLTGCDPITVDGAWRLRAALVAWRFVHGSNA